MKGPERQPFLPVHRHSYYPLDAPTVRRGKAACPKWVSPSVLEFGPPPLGRLMGGSERRLFQRAQRPSYYPLNVPSVRRGKVAPSPWRSRPLMEIIEVVFSRTHGMAMRDRNLRRTSGGSSSFPLSQHLCAPQAPSKRGFHVPHANLERLCRLK